MSEYEKKDCPLKYSRYCQFYRGKHGGVRVFSDCYVYRCKNGHIKQGGYAFVPPKTCECGEQIEPIEPCVSRQIFL